MAPKNIRVEILVIFCGIYRMNIFLSFLVAFYSPTLSNYDVNGNCNQWNYDEMPRLVNELPIEID